MTRTIGGLLVSPLSAMPLIVWGAVATSLISAGAQAMGLRSLVALPVEAGGFVGRTQLLRNADTMTNTGIVNLAAGLSGKGTLLFGLPYRLSPGGANRSGEFSTLYRRIVWQQDRHEGTRRVALLGGILLPTTTNTDARLQGGVVATFYSGRSEFDANVLWQDGAGISPASRRYDLAYQYRLSPAQYPKWGPVSEWDIDVELGGRYTEGLGTTHQLTTGLQWIHRRWVLEVGFIKDLNKRRDRQVLLSLRVHY